MLVTEVQRLTGIGDDLQRTPRRHRTVGVDDVAQRHPVDVLHHDVRQRPGRGLGLAGVVDGDDGGVVERGGVLRFAPEPEVEARVAGQIGAQHFDRDVAVQPQIAGQVHLRHAAEAQDLAQLVAVGKMRRCAHRGDSPSWMVAGAVPMPVCHPAGNAAMSPSAPPGST